MTRKLLVIGAHSADFVWRAGGAIAVTALVFLAATGLIYHVLRDDRARVVNTRGVERLARSIRERVGPEFPLVHVDTPFAFQLYLNTMTPLTSASEAAALLQRPAAAFVAVRDARTWIGDATGRRFLDEGGVPGLGTPGSGDVLAGALAGLLARGAEPTTALVWAVRAHAVAGSMVLGGRLGLLAREVVDALCAAGIAVKHPSQRLEGDALRRARLALGMTSRRRGRAPTRPPPGSGRTPPRGRRSRRARAAPRGRPSSSHRARRARSRAARRGRGRRSPRRSARTQSRCSRRAAGAHRCPGRRGTRATRSRSPRGGRRAPTRSASGCPAAPARSGSRGCRSLPPRAPRT